MTAVLLETVLYLPEPVDTIALTEQGTAYWLQQAKTAHSCSSTVWPISTTQMRRAEQANEEQWNTF